MRVEEYLEQLHDPGLKDMTGYIMGRALKDKDIHPEQYAKLCETALKFGFRFHTIEIL